MPRSHLRVAKERLVPLEAVRNVAYADDRPRTFHRITPCGLTIKRSDLSGTCFTGKTKLLAVFGKKIRSISNSNPSLIDLLHKYHHRISVCLDWSRSCSRKFSNHMNMLYAY